MERQRGDDSVRRVWFRAASRISMQRGLWYVEKRNGELDGPYVNRVQAESMLQSYLQVVNSRFPGGNFTMAVDDDHPASERTVVDSGRRF